MREDLLHYIWKNKKFGLKGLKTCTEQDIQILNFGYHNDHSGPDFIDAKLMIEGQLWAGNVEVHLRSSDWYLHKHNEDRAYDNVILHVVWEDDRPVYNQVGQPLPTLVLSEYVEEDLLDRYRKLLDRSKRRFINCEEYTDEISIFLILPWMEHLFRERLEQKTQQLSSMLADFNNDWEKLLFTALLKNFGQRVNSDSFESIARSLDYSVVRKLGSKTLLLESILLGLSGILQKHPAVDLYQKKLLQEFLYLKRKYGLDQQRVIKPEFMRVRPSNFPTIRLSQFAVLYTTYKNLLTKIIETSNLQALHSLFQIRATKYWDTHFIFGKQTKDQIKVLSKEFINGLIINTVIPITFLYTKMHGKDSYTDLRALLVQIRRENNNLTERYLSMGFPIHSALDSQAIIQLYNAYCKQNRCLECALGNQILN